MENILQRVNTDFVQLDAQEKSRNNTKLQQILNELLVNLRMNQLFGALCKRGYGYTGSYYNNLKVATADEYNVEVIFDLPKLASKQLSPSEMDGHIYASISCDEINRHDYLRPFRGLSNLIDESNYLDVNAVNSWFEGIVQKAVNAIDNVQMVMIKDGPGKRIRVNDYYGNKRFDIVLVPHFYFEGNHWPQGFTTINQEEEFAIVPKLSKDNDSTKWRICAEDKENAILYDMDKIKSAMRLIKVLREKQVNLKPLKSYFIKTVFLHELKTNENRAFYKGKTLTTTFITFMELLIQAIESKTIKYFWDPDMNLIGDWSTNKCLNISCRLKNILHDMKMNPGNRNEYFGKSNNLVVCSNPVPDPSPSSTRSYRNDMAQADNNNGLMLLGGIVAGLYRRIKIRIKRILQLR